MMVNGVEVVDMIDYIGAAENFKKRFDYEGSGETWKDDEMRDRYITLELEDTLKYFKRELASTPELKELLSDTIDKLRELKTTYNKRIYAKSK